MEEEIKFDKYEKKGAYHWKDFNRNSAYRNNALIIKDWIRPGNTLDIGAGDGLITSLIGAVGIDNNKKAIELAREKGVSVINGSAYNLPFDRGEFYNVLMADTLEHLKDDRKAIEEAKRVLRIEGHLYVVTPPKKDKKNKYHYREYTPNELCDLLHHFGFRQYREVYMRKDLNRMYVEFVKLTG
jgi:ubiquinone/menaquinone biosynthesis C-methylase UbiE